MDRKEYLFRSIERMAYGRIVGKNHGLNISEYLLSEVVCGEYRKISLETLEKMNKELEKIYYNRQD